ncbi:MAG: adenosylmethionine decarboxylase [Burkholderiaceae bacterium]
MQGLHLTADLRGCPADAAAMTEPDALRRACLAAVDAVGLHAVGELFHRFAPRPGGAHPPGVTGVVLLAESHLAVHTWPELGAVTLDVYVCNLGTDHSAQAERLMQRLSAHFAPARAERHRLQRGAQ